jgi:hypothetical protein
VTRSAHKFNAGGRSPRKEQAIYDAVHEVIMQLRIKLHRDRPSTWLDTHISEAGHQAGMAAVAAYRKPLPRKKR